MKEVSTLDQYVKDIKELNVKKLTKEEEQEIGYRILNGDKSAVKELIEANLMLVVKRANSYAKKSGYPVEELIQEGNEGLVYAAYKYDVRMGYSFESFAALKIRDAMYRYSINQNSVLTVSSNMKVLIAQYKKALEELEEKNEEITDETMADYLNVPVRDIKMIKRCISVPIELDDDKNNAELGYEDKYSYERDYLRRDLEKIFEKAELNERQLFVLKARFGYYGRIYSLIELGKMLNISNERARQLEARARKKIRKYCCGARLYDYLDD